MEYKFSDKISSLQPSAIREILKATSNPEIIPLAAGNPAPDAFPVEEVQEIAKDILANDPITALQYGVTEGYQPLRDTIKSWMKDRENIGKDFDDILIVSGATQVMDLTTKVLCNEGDTVICEEPSFIGSLNCFRSYGCKLKGIPVDADGMNIDALEEALKTTDKVKFIYTIPNFQNPSGATMSLEKRKRLYALAKEYGVIILEDNPYGDLRVAGESLPTIKSIDDEGIVIYAGSFSKVLAPGIRVAYCIGPKAVLAKMTVGKQASDVHTSCLNQMIVNEWFKKYDVNAHIEKIRGIYREKLELMCKCLDEELGDFVEYVKPEGGLFIWCKLPDNVDMLEFVKKAVEKKVAVVPGNAFLMNDTDSTQYIRLNFSTPTNEGIVKGIKALGEVAKEYK
ncbi:MAG: PLP-dependent aminotransferase family protein [Acetobacter sp.]|nr:PLP-dependent aminotransferase family protein [Bacteroides sp.]MCM1340748.1 PLP-dependent aminotransferase family protein [Acetobacter sp.]MCM1433085.1 PLP-dependent aminotransferase family protein [Clostridiales bacterium]